MARAFTWALGLTASFAVHGAAAGVYLLTQDLKPAPDQQGAQSQLQLDTMTAPRQNALAAQPKADDAQAAQTDATQLQADAIMQSRAQSLVLDAVVTAAVAPAKNTLPPAAPETLAIKADETQSQIVTASAAPSQTLASLSSMSSEAVAPSAVLYDAAQNPELPTQPAAPQIPQSTKAAAVQSDAPKIASAPLPASIAKATTAWQFTDRVVTDATAVATIQAFLSPTSADGDAVKDGLSAVLGGVDCARLSATFLPETGVLELRGHIPNLALSESLLAAMQHQVGDGIPVTANLLHLPNPQCGALAGIADVGLPQSTEQTTNDQLIGETSHARAYEYSQGQRLQFDLVAPDYDAVVYVDYFNANGEVIHLAPNETIALELLSAKSLIKVGAERLGKPSLNITIGPPYGQEIAVAFAASGPLYDGLRPVVEPAAPYLAFLKDKVAQARAFDPDFKGEWVYFFITTKAVP